MVDYREILRLESSGYSQRQIAACVHSSRGTIREVLSLCKELSLEWPLTSDMSNDELRKFLYPTGSMSLPERFLIVPTYTRSWPSRV